MSNELTGDKPHFTTRRGFIATAGFGVVSLYALWVAYGAAPLGLMASGSGRTAPEEAGGHGAHGAPEHQSGITAALHWHRTPATGALIFLFLLTGPSLGYPEQAKDE